MKKKLILIITGLSVLMVSFLIINSCSKFAHESLTSLQKEEQDKNTDTTLVDEKDFTESDEDLMTVDYKEFYEELAPYGEWIQVSPEEVGLKSKITSNNSSGNKNISISNFLGVNDAYADAEMGMVFVWRPSENLTLGMSIGENHEYRPYSDGQWINTDEGWYFRGRTHYEETVSHHGRWVHSKHGGWMWIPGRVWAPAWVDWRQNDDYVSWAPLPPSIYFSDGSISFSLNMDDDDYMIVERRHFIDPDIYRYYNPYYDDGSRISVNLMIGTVGLVVVNNTIINRGPDINIIQNYYSNNINVVNLHHVRDYRDVRYSDKEYNVYSPGFKKYNKKENKNFVRNEPKTFKNFKDVSPRMSHDQDYKKENPQVKNDNKGNENVNKQKGNENVNKQKSNENVNKQKSNENVKKQKSNENVNKQKNNENVKKQKSNENTNKQKSNENVKKQKSSENTNKQKSSENVTKQKSSENTNKQKSNENTNKQNTNTKGKQKK